MIAGRVILVGALIVGSGLTLHLARAPGRSNPRSKERRQGQRGRARHVHRGEREAARRAGQV